MPRSATAQWRTPNLSTLITTTGPWGAEMKLFKLAAVGVMTISLAGCYNAHGGAGAGQGAGTILGAIGGGLLGSQVGSGSGRLWATGAGAL